MKNTDFKVMIQLQVCFFEDTLIVFLTEKIKKIIALVGSNLNVEFEGSEKYWKIPENTKCFWRVYATDGKGVLVSTIKEAFDVQWEYSVTPCHDIHDPEKKVYENESAIWDKKYHGGSLLHKNVEWAHIYTWQD